MSEMKHGIPKEILIGVSVIGIVLVVGMMTGGNSNSVMPVIEDIPHLDVNPNGPVPVETEEPEKDSSDGTIGYPNVYYPVEEIPEIIKVTNVENSEALFFTLEDFEVEDEFIGFVMIHQGGRLNGIDIKVEYLNWERKSFFKTYRVDTWEFRSGERKEQFGEFLANSRHLNNDKPLIIKGVEIKYI